VQVRIKNAYEPPSDDDGRRVLVHRFWPRDLKKADVVVDAWHPGGRTEPYAA
jgi:uncharacterized protein YeaO (DUF488 family)